MRSSKRLSAFLGEQKGTIEYDKEGERITVNFEKKLEVIDRFLRRTCDLGRRLLLERRLRISIDIRW